MAAEAQGQPVPEKERDNDASYSIFGNDPGNGQTQWPRLD